MANSGTNCKAESAPIDGAEITSDNLTGRAGLALFSWYLSALDFMPHVERLFGTMRKSRKGVPIASLFKQILCFFLDGTSPHRVQFDRLKEGRGYASTLETLQQEMASSHQVKRFFAAFSWVRIWKFRTLLQHLFLWRLKLEKPEVVVLGLDTMVMDNSEAKTAVLFTNRPLTFWGILPFVALSIVLHLFTLTGGFWLDRMLIPRGG